MKQNKDTLSIGAQLNSPKRVYTVEAVLGKGGFGITYKVSANVQVDNVTVKTYFAVKEFFLSDSCERDASDSIIFSDPVRNKVEESRKDFYAEAQRLNKVSLRHPNIVHVNEVFEANNTVYYVMEYLDGGSLRNYVRQHGTLSETETLGIMLPIMDAVKYLHDNRMTHLDIKPDNIMLKKDTVTGKITPVLIDFGLSKHYDKSGKPTSTIRVTGVSAGYAPLEQYVGIDTFTPQADVYALAATLYYVLVGKDPAIASEVNEGQIRVTLPPDISCGMAEAIVNGMRMRKEERIQNVCELMSAIKDRNHNINDVEDGQQDDLSETEKIKRNRLSSRGLPRFNMKHRLVSAAVLLTIILAVAVLILKKQAKMPEPEAVDLGLSVKWASCNLGASKPEESGNYYKWGEVEPTDGDLFTYKYSHNGRCGAKYLNLTKYCSDSKDGYNGFTDGKSTLETVDDAATENLRDKWRMPTSNEIKELINKCKCKWATLNGIKGMQVTGPNGNSIFFPACGTYYNYNDDSALHDGDGGYYWSASNSSIEPFYFFITNINGWGCDEGLIRTVGLTIRPVLSK